MNKYTIKVSSPRYGIMFANKGPGQPYQHETYEACLAVIRESAAIHRKRGELVSVTETEFVTADGRRFYIEAEKDAST